MFALWQPRFIPTGVGNTQAKVNQQGAISVHPHGCGEHAKRKVMVCGVRGSSPRVWGTPTLYTKHIEGQRFIPTGVGNTWCLAAVSVFKSVHPHGCGEHSRLPLRQCEASGSSPRVWGTLFILHILYMAFRFIPTGVGNTGVGARYMLVVPVHPHGCGEHVDNYEYSSRVNGSSPRVWGTRHITRGSWIMWRFIPTGVGNTL